MINEVTSDNSDNPELTSKLPPALYTALNTAPNAASDLVELYNKGDQAVDITGWKQIDSHAASSATVFSGRVFDVNGNQITSIPAHGYGVFQSGQGLGSGGDAVQDLPARRHAGRLGHLHAPLRPATTRASTRGNRARAEHRDLSRDRPLPRWRRRGQHQHQRPDHLVVQRQGGLVRIVERRVL